MDTVEANFQINNSVIRSVLHDCVLRSPDAEGHEGGPGTKGTFVMGICQEKRACVFASEHLNINMPVHVIQALLGHATMDTVMVYAKLYPQHLLDELRIPLHAEVTLAVVLSTGLHWEILRREVD